MSSIDEAPLGHDARHTLLATAAASIDSGLREHRPVEIHASDYPPRLRAIQSCFVTILKHGQLRGCIGSLRPTRALIEDVAIQAFAAAFRDPRFPALTPAERPLLRIEISVLAPKTAIEFTSHGDLIAHLRPGVDGLIVRHLTHEATFLPSVWDALPDPETFLQQLRRKAGITDDIPTTELAVWRYEAEKIGAGNSI